MVLGAGPVHCLRCRALVQGAEEPRAPGCVLTGPCAAEGADTRELSREEGASHLPPPRRAGQEPAVAGRPPGLGARLGGSPCRQSTEALLWVKLVVLCLGHAQPCSLPQPQQGADVSLAEGAGQMLQRSPGGDGFSGGCLAMTLWGWHTCSA